MQPILRLPLFLLPFLAPATDAQWAAPLPASADPVTVEGFLAVHDDGASIQAFSAFTQSWLAIGPTTATVVGTGDFVALLELPGGARTAYSARLNATAAGPAGAALAVGVEDDVIYVLMPGGNGTVLHAYSGQTNQWQNVNFLDVPQIASSRFVVCAYSAASAQMAGFGARFGQWNVLITPPCDPPVADGNVAALIQHPAAGIAFALAFSGVTNIWNITPALASGFLAVDHDVALVNVSAIAGNFQACGYSAYTSTWVTSMVNTPAAAVVATPLRDKLVLIVRSPGPRFEAIGAVPHNAWAILNGPMLSVLGLAEDAAVVRDTPGNQVVAFGGLTGGGWVPQAVIGVPTFLGTPEHGAVVSDAGNQFHGFSPMSAAWAMQFVAGGTAHVGECVAVVDSPAGLAFAWSARGGAWILGPAPVAGLTYVHDAVGSIVTRDGRDLAAGDSIDLAIFDERYDRWRTPYPLGGATFASLQAQRNALIVTDGPARLGYSIQRDDVVGMPAAALPIVTTQVEEDVAVLRDSANMLYAFGSPEKTHDMFDYPLDTETQHFSSAVFAGQIVHITVRGAPGDLALLGIGPAFIFPPLPVLGGCLSVAPPYISPPPMVVGGTGVADFKLVLPMLAGPITRWAQGAALNPVTLTISFAGCKAEPLEIF